MYFDTLNPNSGPVWPTRQVQGHLKVKFREKWFERRWLVFPWLWGSLNLSPESVWSHWVKDKVISVKYVDFAKNEFLTADSEWTENFTFRYVFYFFSIMASKVISRSLYVALHMKTAKIRKCVFIGLDYFINMFWGSPNPNLSVSKCIRIYVCRFWYGRLFCVPV